MIGRSGITVAQRLLRAFGLAFHGEAGRELAATAEATLAPLPRFAREVAPYPGAWGTQSRRRTRRDSFGTTVRPAGAKLQRKAAEGKL